MNITKFSDVKHET